MSDKKTKRERETPRTSIIMAEMNNDDIAFSKDKIAEYCEELTRGSLLERFLPDYIEIIVSHHDAIKETGAGDPLPEPIVDNSSLDEKIDFNVAMIKSLTLSSEDVVGVCRTIFELASYRLAEEMMEELPRLQM